MITRPVGKRIIEILELLEEFGDMTYTELWELTDVSEPKYVSIVARRAVALGLLVADDARPSKFSTVPGWREHPLMPKSHRKAKKAAPSPARMPSFVFHLGG